MASRSLIIGFSLLAHVGLAIGLGEIDVQELHAATAIQIAETKKAPPPPPPEPVRAEPPPPKPERKQAAAPAPAAAPEPPKAAPPSAALDAAVPDFGLSLSGGVGGNGMALPAGGSTAKAAPVQRSLTPSTVPAPGGCGEKLVKPKPKSVPQPVYTDQARAAGIEGKVRVELTVDQTGAVVSVRILQGLGYGLDEAAVLAARQAQFEPALECGRPTRATFTISMRFTAS